MPLPGAPTSRGGAGRRRGTILAARYGGPVDDPNEEVGWLPKGGVRYRLLVTRADGVASSHDIAGSLSVGRAEENDVVIGENAVSRLHCVVNLVGDRPCIIDQTSTNGTFVNGERVAHGWLGHGDLVRVGNAELTVQAVGVGAPRTPLPAPGPPGRAAGQGAPLPGQATAPDGGLPPAEVLYRLGALLSSSVDEREAARAVIDLVLEVFPVERVFVLQPASGTEGGEVAVLAQGSRPGQAPVEAPPSSTVVRMTLAQGRAVHSFDVETDEALDRIRSLARARTRLVLSAPLRLGDEVAGVLYADAPGAPDTLALEGAVELFQAVADQASLALGRARLHRELLEKNEELRRQRDRLDELNRQLGGRYRQSAALADAQAAELAARLAELHGLHAARESMARGLAHDIRNLVGAVSANLTYLQSEATPGGEAAQAAADGLEAARRIVELTEDVLAVSRMEQGAFQLLIQSLVVEQALASCIRRHSGHARDLGVGLELDAVEPGLVVTADSKVLGRILDNLVGNALRYAGRGGRVRLSARLADRSVAIVVADSGPGVPPELRQKVFDEWHTTRDGEARHHGLGLHFCHLAAAAHGGGVRIDGGPGDNRFVVELPARRLDDDSENTVAQRATLPAAGRPRRA